jgi:hypothetical protein
MATQVSVFVENKPGRVAKIARVLGDSNINIRAVTISDRGDYGMINILADDPDRASSVLTNEGFSVSRNHVIGVVMEDRPGGLADIAEYLNKSEVNISNAYGFIQKAGDRAVLILEVDDFIKAQKVIRKGGFKTLVEEELHNI